MFQINNNLFCNIFYIKEKEEETELYFIHKDFIKTYS